VGGVGVFGSWGVLVVCGGFSVSWRCWFCVFCLGGGGGCVGVVWGVGKVYRLGLSRSRNEWECRVSWFPLW